MLTKKGKNNKRSFTSITDKKVLVFFVDYKSFSDFIFTMLHLFSSETFKHPDVYNNVNFLWFML